ncbi:MAG: hypothetical protein EXS18_03050 [Verrucomicrobiae bacterium]|nr:hypothetical protein [Verrucomicrobiae bacterium]
MNMTFTVTQLAEDSIGPESSKRTAPIGEVLFQEMRCLFGVLPRFDVLNDTLRQGQIVNAKNQEFRWSAFELSRSEYGDLKREVLLHPEWETDVDETFSGTIQEWSHWALVRAISK